MRRFSIYTVLLLTTATVYAEGKAMRPGNWEISIDTTMVGMPMKLPPHVLTKCMKPEDVKDPRRIIQHDPKSSDCELTNVKQDGATVTWTMECKARKASGTGTMTYAGDSYEGTVTMKMTDSHGTERNMVQNIKGRRVGECP